MAITIVKTNITRRNKGRRRRLSGRILFSRKIREIMEKRSNRLRVTRAQISPTNDEIQASLLNERWRHDGLRLENQYKYDKYNNNDSEWDKYDDDDSQRQPCGVRLGSYSDGEAQIARKGLLSQPLINRLSREASTIATVVMDDCYNIKVKEDNNNNPSQPWWSYKQDSAHVLLFWVLSSNSLIAVHLCWASPYTTRCHKHTVYARRHLRAKIRA